MGVNKIRLMDASSGYNSSGPTYNLRYYVGTDDRMTGPKTVREALPFTYGDYYELGSESDTAAIATDIEVEQVDEGNFTSYHADIDFSVAEQKDPTIIDNPLLASVEESYGFTPRSKPVAFDINNKPYMTTAFELIEHERAVNCRTMQFIRNEATINNALVEAVKDAINGSIWKGYAPFTVKVASITHEVVYNPKLVNRRYFRVTYTFEVDYDTWKFRPLNAGLNHIAPDGFGFNRLMPIVIGGFPVDRPVPLSLAGRSLRNPDTGNLTGLPFLLEFDDFPVVNFNTVFAGL
jgi:hypothetical protein